MHYIAIGIPDWCIFRLCSVLYYIQSLHVQSYINLIKLSECVVH